MCFVVCSRSYAVLMFRCVVGLMFLFCVDLCVGLCCVHLFVIVLFALCLWLVLCCRELVCVC